MYEAKAFIYVIKPDGHDVCKVGVTDALSCRLTELQCGAWAKLRCAAAVAVVEGNAVRLEQAVHRHLKAGGHHAIGEWFNVDPVTAVEAIVAVADARGVAVTSLHDLRDQKEEANRRRVRAEEAERLRILRQKLGIE